MALKVNAALTFSGYDVNDDGTVLRFVCADPGAGEPSEYSVLLTDADLSAVSTQPQLRTLVISKLQRRYRAAVVASKLDQFVGQSVTI